MLKPPKRNALKKPLNPLEFLVKHPLNRRRLNRALSNAALKPATPMYLASALSKPAPARFLLSKGLNARRLLGLGFNAQALARRNYNPRTLLALGFSQAAINAAFAGKK